MADSPTPNPVPAQTPVPPPAPVQPPPMPTPARPDPTHHDPSVEPHPSKSSTPIKIALIVLFALLLGAATFLVVWPRLSRAPATSPQNTTSTEGNIVPPLGETPEVVTPTTTGTPTMPTPSINEPVTINRGSADVWFVGDEKIIRDPKTGHLWSVRAVEFGDSRCPANVVCIWAGEQTVTLDVKDLSTGRTERIILGTSRGRTASANGLTLNLIEIDDGKGGVYAEIKVD
jgi:hypothetical protein